MTIVLVIYEVAINASPAMNPVKCHTKVFPKYGGLFVNCSGQNRKKVPVIKGFIVGLDLSANQIRLSGRDFQTYSYLQYLSLENNNLTKLPHDVFAGCRQLKVLNVKNNELKYDSRSFPEKVFSPLKNLEVLNIGNNIAVGTFPDKVIESLTSLLSLTMDTPSNVTFGRGFANLHRLDILCLSGNEAECGLEALYNDTFSVFNSTNVQTLDLSSCTQLKTIYLDSLSPFTNLQTLNLSHAYSLGIAGALLSLYGLQNRTMMSIDLQDVKLRQHAKLTTEKSVEDQILTKEKVQYLSTICLSRLNLVNNHLLFIDIGNINTTAIYRCVEYLYLQGNAFDLQFDLVSITQSSYPNVSLQYVDVSSNQWCGHSSHSNDFDSSVIFIKLPKTLGTIVFDGTNTAVHLKKSITVAINGSTSLKNLSISFNDDMILQGVVTGLEKLTTMRLKHNGDMSLSETFFDTFPSLENLYLTGSRFSEDFFQQESIRLFKNLTELRNLDLSFSNIYYLPRRSYRYNPKLANLSLAHCFLEDISFSLNDVPTLTNFDLSFNLIKTFDEDTRNSLDRHARNHSQFALRLDNNQLICGCENIDFVVWLKQTDYILNFNNIRCTNESNKLILFKDIRVEYMWRSCTGKLVFYIVSSIFAMLISAALCSFLVVKHKTQLVVFFHRLFRGVVGLPKREDFQYDVFVGYAERDYRFACKQLREILEDRFHYRIFLHDRDSQLGDSRANSILDGVRNSWKLVLVLSENFVREDWSLYTMHAVALYAVSGHIPRRLVVLLDRGNPCQVPDTLLCAVDEDAILTIPRPRDHDAWEHIARLLK